MENKRSRLTEIYADYLPIVFNAVFTKVGNRDDTKDICQEVFIRLFQKIDEVENPRKWLFSALKLVTLEYFRKKRTDDHLNVEDVFNDVGLTFTNGFRDTRIIISEAMENMENFQDEKDRIIFDFIAVSNFSYGNTAKILGLTRRQVEYKYGLIVDRILKYLAQKGIKSIQDLL
jgi:RNA polymerase sigma factor (sigma-70 family)